jgi:hypothetical protein
MKEVAMQSSAARSAAVNSPLNGTDSMAALAGECEPNAATWGPAALEQRRERTRDHLAKIAPRRENWINRNRYYYELPERLLRFLVEPQKKVLSVRRLCQAKRTQLLDPGSGRARTSRIIFLAHGRQ